MTRRLVDRPALAALVGAFCIAFSRILYEVAHVSPSWWILPSLWAVPPLLLLAHWEDRRLGPRARAPSLATLAGFFLTRDLIVRRRAIGDVGAGLATVLGNLQVVLVEPIAWLLLREQPRVRSLPRCHWRRSVCC